MRTGCTAWLLAGGAHHTCFSQNLQSEHLEDFATMAGLEYVLIDRQTSLHRFKNELKWNEAAY
jgi:L-arabinose isomerase